MYSLTVCDHIMIAHSFQGEEFGPAQRMPGATFAVEAVCRGRPLDHPPLLVDIGLSNAELRHVLCTVDYSNLDENPVLKGINTTTEYMAFHIHRLLAAACLDGRLGHGGRAVAWLKILLREAPTAWAAFEGPLTVEKQ